MHRRGNRPSSTLLIAVILMLSFSTFAFSAETVAHMRPGAVSVEWSPLVSSGGIDATIVGPDGMTYRRSFPEGTTPTFRLFDVPKEAQLNGAYTYELRVTPKISADVRQQLAVAREANDDAAIERIVHANNLNAAPVQSGTFVVVSGAVVAAEAAEPRTATPHAKSITGNANLAGVAGSAGHGTKIATDNQVIATDLIVQGSECLGIDCTTTETFGFDTLKLKENNLRILFDDTSTSAGFPANDWQLTANDSASGGANKFSIEDITGSKVPFTVTAGAPTNSFFMASDGKIGLHTATPGLDVTISTGNTPAIRLEQLNTGGFTAQTWDVAGNEANFFVRDITGGSKLPFRIRPGAPTSSIDIAASGNVGVGSASPTARLYVSDTTQAASRVTLAGQEYLAASNTSTDGIAFLLGVNRTANRQLWITDSSLLSTTAPAIRIFPNAGEIDSITVSSTGTVTAADLKLNATGGNIGIGKTPTQPIDHSNGAYLSTGGVWTNASSRSYKQDITNLSTDEAKCALENLEPVKYAYKADPTEHHVGFIAEDVPDLVATKDRKSLSSMDVVAVLTKVVQQQEKTIDELNARLKKLEDDKQ
jgi:hypothetical protein